MVKAIRNGAALVVLLLLGWHLLGSFASDEEKIRGLITDTAAAFNQGSNSKAIAAFHPRWRDGNTGLERQVLRQALAYLTLSARDGGATYRVEVDREGLTLELGPDGEEPRRAEAVFRLTLLQGREESWEPRWVADITAELTEDPKLGWCFRASGWETIEGRPPGR